MIDYTTNLNLAKPRLDELITPAQFNSNFDIIDAALNEPVGTTKMGMTNPYGAKGLLCNGAALNTATYPALAAVLRDAPALDWAATGVSGDTSFEVVKFGNYWVKRTGNGGGVSIYYATDPAGVWTVSTFTNIASIYKIKVVNGYLVVLGRNLANTSQMVFYSNTTPDYASFTGVAVSSNVNYLISDIVHDGTYYYVLTFVTNGSGVIYYCATIGGTWVAGNGTTLTGITSAFGSPNQGCGNMVYGAGNISVIYNNAQAVYSWYMTTAQARSSGGSWQGLGANATGLYAVYDGARFVFVSTPSGTYETAVKIYYSTAPPLSTNLTARRIKTLPPSCTASTLRLLDGVLYIVGQLQSSSSPIGTYILSTDDVTKSWDYIEIVPTSQFTDIAKDSVNFVAGGYSTTTVFSCPAKRLPLLADDVLNSYIKALT